MKKLATYLPEKVVFIVMLVLGLLPLFGGIFFITLDGPSHIYNSLMIQELLSNSNSFINDYLQFTKHPVPNWSGHFILAVLTIFLPEFLAEKIMVAAYLIFFPLGFRKLIFETAPENTFLSFFAFPFSWSFALFLGFYNFLIAWIPFTFGMLLLLQAFQNPRDYKKWIFAGFLALLTYFSHLFVFAVFCLSAVVLFLIQNRKPNTNYLIKTTAALFSTFIIPALLACYHVFYGPPSGEPVYLSATQLTREIINLKPLTALNSSIEGIWYQILSGLIVLLVIVGLYFKVMKPSAAVKKMNPKTANSKLLWIFMTFIFLLLIYTLPDSNGNAGFFSIRIILFFSIFLILSLSGLQFPKILKYIVPAIVFTVQIATGIYYVKAGKINNRAAQECFEAGKYIEPDKTVMELNYSPHWLYLHFSHYAGFTNKPVFLHNYEAALHYFPLTFNRESMPDNRFGNQTNEQDTCLYWESNQDNLPRDIDYVIIIGTPPRVPDACTNQTLQTIKTHYRNIYDSHNCKLYQKKATSEF